MSRGARSEVIVAGGGVAGLMTAWLLGREGIAVEVLDPVPLPRDRVCGEGVMPLGLEVLRRAGLEPEALPGAPFRGLQFATRRQSHAVDFAEGRAGRGIRRTTLIRALYERAAAQPAVRFRALAARAPLWERGRVVGVDTPAGPVRAAAVVAADGVRSRLLRAAGTPLHARGERYGLRQHFRTAEARVPERVQVGLFPPHDLYLTPVGPREVLATTMTDRRGFDAVRRDYAGFVRGTPFGARFRRAGPASARLGWRQPLFRAGAFAPGGMLVVGDAGGGIDPCLGLGISFALASAEKAAETLRRRLAQPGAAAGAEAAYAGWRDRLFDDYAWFDSLFRLLVTSRAGSGALLWGMRHWPETAGAVTRIVAEHRPWRTFPWKSLLHPV